MRPQMTRTWCPSVPSEGKDWEGPSGFLIGRRRNRFCRVCRFARLHGSSESVEELSNGRCPVLSINSTNEGRQPLSLLTLLILQRRRVWCHFPIYQLNNSCAHLAILWPCL